MIDTNKYDQINRPLSEEFTKLVIDFAKMAEDEEEEKIMILMAREVWNISYFSHHAQYEEIESFVSSLDVDQSKRNTYRSVMAQGIRDKKNATKHIDMQDVWSRVENLKVWKVQGKYRVEFEFEFYE